MLRPTPAVLLAAALLTSAAPALAQVTVPAQSRGLAPGAAPGAAATLPNTFDPPARRAAPPPTAAASGPVAAPLSSPAAGPTAGQVTEADMAEGALRAVIADLRSGQIDPDLFTEDMAARLRPQLATLAPLVQGFGDLGPILPQGLNNGANQFEVIFDNAVTQWVVGLDEDGRIAALLFRPAPPVSSEPEAEPVAPQS